MSMKIIHRSTTKLNLIYLAVMIAISLLISINLHARKPAIEPVMGISLEEYKHLSTAPEHWPDFSKNETTAPTRIKSKRELPEVTTDSLKKNSEATFPTYLAVLIALLPFAILGAIILPVSRKKEQDELDSNVTDIRDAAKKRDDDNSWPKAS